MWIDLLPIALLGGLLGLDVVSFPQAMISRPLAAATIAGALIGNSPSGLLIGAALELVALDTLPFGASRYPEWGSAAVVGGAIFATHPSHPAGAMEMAIIASLSTAWIGGWTMVKLRERNALWAARRRDALDAGSRGAVLDLQLLCMTADFLRGAVLAAVSYGVFASLTRLTLGAWSTDARISRAVVVTVAASVAAGAAWKIFHGVSGARWFFLGGLAVGLAIMGTR
jgi:mannose/fructose/N-acetylgalactosamine-specific phosphotransferase system component IIC